MVTRILVLALLVLLTACAAGNNEELLGFPTVADPDAEDSGSTSDDGSSDDEHGEKTGATPLDVDDDTTAGDDSLESSTDGGSSEESTTTVEPEPEPEPEPVEPEPEPEPTGTPMYAPCTDGTECEGGVCVRLVADGIELGSYCSAACENPVADCDAASGSADPLCLVIDTSVVCGLSCTGGLSCPTGMSCFAFTSGDYCF